MIALCGGALIDDAAVNINAAGAPEQYHDGSHRKQQGKQKEQDENCWRRHQNSYSNHELRRSRIPAVDGEPLIDVLPEGDDPPIDILLEEDDGQGEPLMDVLPEED